MFDSPVADATPDATIDRVTALEGTVRDLRALLAEEQTRQINGSDLRLTNFWDEALRLADEAGHCEVFDNLAAALGGPRRHVSYTVEYTITGRTTVTVNRGDEPDVETLRRETYYLSNLTDGSDWSDVEVFNVEQADD